MKSYPYLIHETSADGEHVKPNLKYNFSNGIMLLCYFSPNAGKFTY